MVMIVQALSGSLHYFEIRFRLPMIVADRVSGAVSACEIVTLRHMFLTQDVGQAIVAVAIVRACFFYQ